MSILVRARLPCKSHSCVDSHCLRGSPQLHAPAAELRSKLDFSRTFSCCNFLGIPASILIVFQGFPACRWHKLHALGSSLSGRYAATCNMVAGRILLFGGTDASRTFASLVCMSLTLDKRLTKLANNLTVLCPQDLSMPSQSA